MKRLLKHAANINTEVLNILKELKEKYPPKQSSGFWIKMKDQTNNTWLLFQAVIFLLKSKKIFAKDNELIPILNKFIDEQVMPELDNNISPKILPLLNSYSDHLRIDFDPADPNERDGPIVVVREFAQTDIKDHAFIGKKGETHSQIQSQHPEIMQHCRDEQGIDIICHGNYWRPIAFLSSFNQYKDDKLVANIIKTQHPQVEKVFSFNGGSRGGIVHKEAKKRLLN